MGQVMSHVDVLIVGAGLSGISAAVHLQRNCPKKSYAILEARSVIGGTWDLFRYPGIRSDSDMFTLGYSFKPWLEAKAIADGPSILNYVRETAEEHHITQHIRYGHKVIRADWSTADAAWTVGVEVTDEQGTTNQSITCNFLFMCSGYYDYDQGYTPEFLGREDFAGRIVHPQFWPQDLDYAGKRVIVIGSGATAVTLVPEMAKTAAHVIMLQRSPTYVVSRPAADKVADWLRDHLPAMLAYRLIRWRNVLFGMYFFNKARKQPKQVKDWLLARVRDQLGPDYDIEKHFTPKYNPWDQRLCLVPDADMFDAIKSGAASVVTDHIDRFTKTGILLKSGQELQADVIVTATGLNMKFLAGLQATIDGQAIDFPKTYGYKGMMYSGVPNLASSFGYTNASWTLKCDLTCDYVCRLLNHMDEKGLMQCTPVPNQEIPVAQDWLDFSSGYVQRALDKMPKQGDKAPWKLYQNYALDLVMLRYGALDDGTLRFSNPVRSKQAAE
jgi:cation diffusion facilitator CzcD-associated flavoprotein CzcO